MRHESSLNTNVGSGGSRNGKEIGDMEKEISGF